MGPRSQSPWHPTHVTASTSASVSLAARVKSSYSFRDPLAAQPVPMQIRTHLPVSLCRSR